MFTILCAQYQKETGVDLAFRLKREDTCWNQHEKLVTIRNHKTDHSPKFTMFSENCELRLELQPPRW